MSMYLRLNGIFNCEKMNSPHSIGSKKNPKSQALYEKTNRLVEKLSVIAYLVIIKLGLPGLMLANEIVSYFIYFTTDAGSDAFELPFSAW